METIEKKQSLVETNELVMSNRINLIVKQHVEIVSHIKQISDMQSEIAKQLVKQHEDIESLYIGLGLKKELSYYSFDLMNAEEH